MNWRETAGPIIAEVLAANKGADEKTIRKALFDAYPFGQRKYHPYKIWLDEIARQRGKKWPIGHKLAWKNNKIRERYQYTKLQEWEELYGAFRDEKARG